jgi:ABC-2 type transport system permease protein
VRREFWEHRSLYLAPLIAAALILLGFLISLTHLPAAVRAAPQLAIRGFLVVPYDIAADALMLVYMLVALFYCLEALHGERRDRSLLFWKSLPVSDLTAVLAKASIPLLVLPLAVFAITVALHVIMLLIGGAALAASGESVAAIGSAVPVLAMWLALLCHLLTVHALYPAPIYGWLLLVSAFVRRATFLWAVLPPLAIVFLERVVFHTHHFASMLLTRIGGGPNGIPFPPAGGMRVQPVTPGALWSFLSSPGLWIGLAVFAVFLAAAVRLRRYQGPI